MSDNLNANAVKLVAAGAEYLDKSSKAPSDWRQKIDTSKLSISDGSLCILGQLFGGYYKGLGALSMASSYAEKLGFVAQDSYPYVTSSQLTAAWKAFLADDLKVGQVYKDQYGDAYRVEAIVTREDDGKTVVVYTSGSITSAREFKSYGDTMYTMGVERVKKLTLHVKTEYKNGDVYSGSRDGKSVTLIVNNLGGTHEMLCFDGSTFVTHCPIAYFEKNYGPLQKATFMSEPVNIRSVVSGR